MLGYYSLGGICSAYDKVINFFNVRVERRFLHVKSTPFHLYEEFMPLLRNSVLSPRPDVKHSGDLQAI